MSDKVIIKVVDSGFNYKVSLNGQPRIIAGAMVILLKMLADSLEEAGRSEEEVNKMMSQVWDEYKKARTKQ